VEAFINEWAREWLPVHLERMEDKLPDTVTSRETWRWLAHPNLIDHVVRAPVPVTPGRIVHHTQTFGQLFLMVSSFPSANFRKIRKKLLPEGYMAMLDPVMHSSGFSSGSVDLAHWLLFKDEDGSALVLLCYLAANREAIPLLPLELLSSKERRQVGSYII
jgi:hypothetical protein